MICLENYKVQTSQNNALQLQSNLEMGHNISNYANEIIYYSNNNSNRPRMKAEIQAYKDKSQHPKQDINNLNDHVHDKLTKIWEKNKSLNGSGGIREKELVLLRAKDAEEHHVGNCHEMSAVGFSYAYRNNIPQRVEIFYIKGGNHLFIVIGRKPNSDPKDPKTWGADCVICDSWAQKVYPASEIESRMENYVSRFMHEETGEIGCVLEPYNPMKHQFREMYPHANHPNRPTHAVAIARVLVLALGLILYMSYIHLY